MTAVITPVRKSRMYEDVMRQIQGLIDSKQIKPGEKLSAERELAEQFQVNRTTLRQALHSLSMLRVLDIRPGDGVYVRENPDEASIESILLKKLYGGEFTSGTLRDVIELRMFLEIPIAEKAAKLRDKKEIAALETHLNAMRENFSPEFNAENFMLADFNFHAQLAKMAHNELVVRLMNSFYLLLKDFKPILIPSKERAKLSLAQHTKIFNAINQGRVTEAGKGMSEHLTSVETVL